MKWIPLSERLPNAEEDVLICVKETEYCKDGKKLYYYWQSVGWYIDTKWYSVYIHGSKSIEGENNSFSINEVVAWMPLPEPYTKEETE